MLKLVEAIQTTYTIEELIRAFVLAWFNIYKSKGKKSSIAVIYAQNALETGSTLFQWNNNIGNIKAVDIPGQIVEYMALNNVWEIINGKKVILSKDDPGAWFRSFPTLASGVEEHFKFLRNNRYKKAWTAIENGDPVQFAHLLKVAGYYTAAETDYIKGLQYHFNIFMNGKTFDKVMNDLQPYFNQIEYPDDYTEIDLTKKDS